MLERFYDDNVLFSDRVYDLANQFLDFETSAASRLMAAVTSSVSRA